MILKAAATALIASWIAGIALLFALGRTEIPRTPVPVIGTEMSLHQSFARLDRALDNLLDTVQRAVADRATTQPSRLYLGPACGASRTPTGWQPFGPCWTWPARSASPDEQLVGQPR